MDRLRRLAIITALTLAVAIGGCEAGGDSETSPPPAPTTAAPEPPRPARRLAVAPSDCRGPAPRMVAFADYGNLIGTSPVWAGVYAGFDRSNQSYHLEPDAPRTEHGWRVKILWVLGPKLDRPARAVGREVGGGQSLWFEVEDRDDEPAPVAILNPATPGVPATGDAYKEFPSYAYVPKAGCYLLEAHWPAGKWRLVVGLGR